MRLLIAAAALIMSSQIHAQSTPEETLEKYFSILTGRDFTGIETLMDSKSMASLKETMDSAIRYQANHGVYRLQRRIFGKKVSMAEVDAASASFYLQSLAGEILEAARAQHLVVEEREILGKVAESDTMVHIVARLNMEQDGTHGSQVLVYTAVKEGDLWKLEFPATIRQMLTVIEGSARQIR